MQNLTVMNNFIIISLCTLFNSKPEHGDVFINSKNFIKLLTNFHLFSTLPLNVLDFPLEYFPFTSKSQIPILFITSTLFSFNSSFFEENKIKNDLKVTAIIITLLHLLIIDEKLDVKQKLETHSFNDGKELLKSLWDDLYSSDKSSFRLQYSNLINFSDLDLLSDYLYSYLFKTYPTFHEFLKDYEISHGVDYDFFR